MRRPAALLAVGLLAACQNGGAGPPPADPPVLPVPTARGPIIQDFSRAESAAAALEYRRLERRLRAEGRLRRDGGAAVAYSAADLADTFQEIAFRSEFRIGDGGYFTGAGVVGDGLLRWRDPVRVQLHFGRSVALDDRRRDRAMLERYAARLARATRHPVSVVPEGGNLHVFVAGLDEQAALGARFRRLLPPDGYARAASIAALGPSAYCAIVTWPAPGDPFTAEVAVAFVRSELPDLSRLACYHEEIAQGLGLGRDSRTARPSVFNEDDEFATLTRHDEQLLRILYDPRLSPGMTAREAAPIVRRIAAELAPPGAS